MIVLGLQFGHDASISVIKDGVVASYVYRERYSKVKHAIGLDDETLRTALSDAGVSLEQIDYCAICSTQGVELLTDAIDLKIDFRRPPQDRAPCYLLEEIGADQGALEARLQHNLIGTLFSDELAGSTWKATWAKMFPIAPGKTREDFTATGWLDDFIGRPAWTEGRSFEALGKAQVALADSQRFGFHLAVTATLLGRVIPAYFIHHHMAHAASSYYSSPYRSAAVMTHDGYADGTSYHSGMYYFGQENRLYPLSPHHLNIGALYDRVGLHLQLGLTGPAGKLMGLAAYGKPRFFDASFVGNYYDQKEVSAATDISSAWLYHCARSASQMGYDMTHYTDPAHATDRINADIAASTQKLFEEIRYRAVQTLHRLLKNNDLSTDNLCLSGGTALNCPSNSQLYNESPFSNLYIEPACDDGGLSIGAALAVYHNILDQPRGAAPVKDAYLGVRHASGALAQLLAAHENELDFERHDQPGVVAAHDVFNNMVIGWYQGRSEAGPRALGHRSIVADPRIADNWERVNRLKKREQWRPFAPAVLAEQAHAWFSHLPASSPYMLFNARVRSNAIPAVTHVDGTARIQTVTPDNGEYYQLIKEFFALSEVPVVLNTSLNGPGEPIVETAQDAVDFFLASELDVMFIDQHRITKRHKRPAANPGAST